MTSTTRKYRQAALTYLVYGLLYWGGGLYLIAHGVSEQNETAWFVIGALFILVFPALIWNGARSKILMWFTRILAALVLVRVFGLVGVIVQDAGRQTPTPWGGEMPLVYGALVFLLVAAFTCWMLARAGWNIALDKQRAVNPEPPPDDVALEQPKPLEYDP